MSSVAIFFIVAIILLLLGANVATTLGISSILVFLIEGIPTSTVIQRLFSGVDIVALLCIPFFILAGDLMAKGGIAKRLVDVANVFVGNITGGLAYVTIIVCCIFAAMTGSAMACCVTIGSIMLPYMLKAGYSREYSTAVISAGSVLGPIIPPSTAMIIYAVATSTSLTDLYLLGLPAGIIMAVALCIMAYIISKKNGYKGLEKNKMSAREIMKMILGALPAVGSPVIILGSIYSGICTPTESAVLAVLYSLIIGIFVYKEMNIRDIPKILLNSAIGTSKIMYIVAASGLFAWVISYARIPQIVLDSMLSLTTNKYALLILILIILLIMGAIMDATPIMLITIPMFIPIIKEIGVDPLHFGIIMTVAVCIGFVTPPFGTCLFTGMTVGNVTMQQLVKKIIPFILVMVFILLLITFIPQLTMWIV